MNLNKNTHIMGRTGTGKTYFAMNSANEMLNEEKKIIYISFFDDLEGLELDKVEITNDNDIDLIISALGDKKSINILISKAKIGVDKTLEIAKLIAESLNAQQEILNGYIIVIDEVQNIEPKELNILLEGSNNNSYVVCMIHQYLEQLSNDTILVVKNLFSQGVYFRMATPDIEEVLKIFNSDKYQEEDCLNLPENEYIVLQK